MGSVFCVSSLFSSIMPVKSSRSRRVSGAAPASDPAPVPPHEPALEDCCQSGCAPCIFDLYQEALERYRIALQTWQRRQDKA
jgi:hypothetical protein